MPRDLLADEEDYQPATITKLPRDFLAEPEQEKESLGTSAALAIPRIGVDVAKGIYNFAKEIPDYYETAKTEAPGIIDVIKQHPAHAGGQALAGLAELGKNVFNTPHDLINYMTNRLNLIPEDINRKVQMGRMPEEDTQNAINKIFGEPEYQGETAIRGLTRNALNLLAGGAGLKALNPMKLTNKGIAKSVISELGNQVEKHTNMYNQLWKDAQRAGINQVPFDANLIGSDLATIKKYYTPKQYKAFEEFTNNPTLENAQRAQSDLGVLSRALSEKARTTPLLGEERALYDSLVNSEKYIENNMFKDQTGKINQKLADRYKNLSKSYRENVVPYKYNPDIQAFRNKELTAKELVKRLNKGKFAAKKASAHPSFAMKNALWPVLVGSGALGTIGGAKYLYDQIFGNPSENPFAAK